MACNLSPNDKAIIQELNKLKYDINKIFGSDQDLCKGIFEVDKAKEKEFQDKNGEEYKITENERVKTPEKQNKKDKQRERQKKKQKEKEKEIQKRRVLEIEKELEIIKEKIAIKEVIER